MSLLARVWVALTAVMGLVLAVLAFLSILQHDAILSQLIRQRLAVTVESAARPFRSVVEMGLPVSMMRDKRVVLERARGTDAAIAEVVLLNQTGIVVETTATRRTGPVSSEILSVLSQSAGSRWSLETATELISGSSILNSAGTVVAGVLAIYPRNELEARSAVVTRQIGLAAAALLVLFSGVAYVVIRLPLRSVIAGLSRLDRTLASLGKDLRPDPRAGEDETPGTEKLGELGAALAALEKNLGIASRNYREATARLAPLCPQNAAPPRLEGRRESVLVGIPETALTRSIARRLTPIVAALTLVSALALGHVAYRSINDSFGPEIAKRTQLIRTAAGASIQRTIEAGVPIESLVGGFEYFTHLLADFPEISYFAVIADKPVVEVGRLSTQTGASTRVFRSSSTASESARSSLRRTSATSPPSSVTWSWTSVSLSSSSSSSPLSSSS